MPLPWRNIGDRIGSILHNVEPPDIREILGDFKNQRRVQLFQPAHDLRGLQSATPLGCALIPDDVHVAIGSNIGFAVLAILNDTLLLFDMELPLLVDPLDRFRRKDLSPGCHYVFVPTGWKMPQTANVVVAPEPFGRHRIRISWVSTVLFLMAAAVLISPSKPTSVIPMPLSRMSRRRWAVDVATLANSNAVYHVVPPSGLVWISTSKVTPLTPAKAVTSRMIAAASQIGKRSEERRVGKECRSRW